MIFKRYRNSKMRDVDFVVTNDGKTETDLNYSVDYVTGFWVLRHNDTVLVRDSISHDKFYTDNWQVLKYVEVRTVEESIQ